MDKFVKPIAVFVVLVVVLGLNAFVSWLLMAAWNYVMPYLFHLPVINFWMAFAIVCIASILFPKGSKG